MEEDTIDIISLTKRLTWNVASCIIEEPNFTTEFGERERKMFDLCIEVADQSPEFIWQLGWYARCKLGLKCTANFLLAFAVQRLKKSGLIKKYLPFSILKLSELIEVVNIIQVLCENKSSKPVLPSCLKKIAPRLFENFDENEMKHCYYEQKKNKLKKPKKKEQKVVPRRGRGRSRGMYRRRRGGYSSDESEEEKSEVPEKKPEYHKITIKKLIRNCHISEPKLVIMCLLGKKYPEKEIFEKYFPSLPFEEEKVGKKMNFYITPTWKKEFEKKDRTKILIDAIEKRNFPYLDMLNNINLLFKYNIPEKMHQEVCNLIQSPSEIEKSQATLFKILFAFQNFRTQIADLKLLIDYFREDEEMIGERRMNIALTRCRRPFFGRRGRYPNRVRISYKKKMRNKNIVDKLNLSPELLELYQKSFEKAIEIAIKHNNIKMTGRTVVFIDSSASMECPVECSSFLPEFIRSCFSMAVLMGLLIRLACKNSEIVLFAGALPNCPNYFSFSKFPEENVQNYLENIKAETGKLGKLSDFPFEFWDAAIAKKDIIDKVVVISNRLMAKGCFDIERNGCTASEKIAQYRREVNPNLVYIAVDLRGFSQLCKYQEDPTNSNNIYLSRISDSLIRFLGEIEENRAFYITSLTSTIQFQFSQK